MRGSFQRPILIRKAGAQIGTETLQTTIKQIFGFEKAIKNVKAKKIVVVQKLDGLALSPIQCLKIVL